MADFSGATGGANPELPIQNDRAPDGLADPNIEKVASTAAGARLVFAVSRGVGIVLELKPQAGGFHQLRMDVVPGG